MAVNKIDDIIKSIKTSNCNKDVVEVLTHSNEAIRIFHNVRSFKHDNIGNDDVSVELKSDGIKTFYQIDIELLS